VKQVAATRFQFIKPEKKSIGWMFPGLPASLAFFTDRSILRYGTFVLYTKGDQIIVRRENSLGKIRRPPDRHTPPIAVRIVAHRDRPVERLIEEIVAKHVSTRRELSLERGACAVPSVTKTRGLLLFWCQLHSDKQFDTIPLLPFYRADSTPFTTPVPSVKHHFLGPAKNSVTRVPCRTSW
jgi:hypothetical protein